MPNREMYMISIILIAFSSISLIIIQSILYFFNHKIKREFILYKMDYDLAKYKFEKFRRNFDKMTT
jgi:hypothetical protein